MVVAKKLLMLVAPLALSRAAACAHTKTASQQVTMNVIVGSRLEMNDSSHMTLHMAIPLKGGVA